jgi:hypothetical protein
MVQLQVSYLMMLIDEAAVSVRLPLDQWTADMSGRGGFRLVPVMSPADIANMPTEKVLVIRRGVGAFVGRTPTVLELPGWKPLPLITRAPIPQPAAQGADEGQDVAAPAPQRPTGRAAMPCRPGGPL